MENENFKNESRWGSVRFSFYRYANYFLENKEATNKFQLSLFLCLSVMYLLWSVFQRMHEIIIDKIENKFE